MKKWVAAALVTATVVLAACGSDEDGDDDAAATAEPTAVATSPTAASEPSQEAAGAVEANAYTAETAFPQLTFDRMVEIEQIPGTEDAVVVTQDGVVKRFSLTDDDAEPTTFLDITSKIISNPGTEEGLLGLEFDPDFALNRRYYVYYSSGPPRQTILDRYVDAGPGANPVAEQLLAIDDPYRNHNGGALEFGPDGYLYLGVGDGGSGGDPEENGQDTNALLGKIHRFDVSSGGPYTIPPDNPFVNGGGRPEIFAYGFRNPWRFSFDMETGALWVGDVGQDEFEEIDLVTIGGNYGWNIMEGAECFEAETCDQTSLTLPRATYGRDSGCSVTGGYVYRGDEMPELDGWYVYGDYCSGNVWAFDTTSEDSEPVLIAETGLQIPSFWQDEDGEIYIITFNNAVAKLVHR